MKAIETRYKGYRFRSRLEARYAVFLDSLGEPWEYELEGYELPSGRYLPDFWLPRLECWLEIKGPKPTYEEEVLCNELAWSTDNPVVLAHGLPQSPCSVSTGHITRWIADGLTVWCQDFGDGSAGWIALNGCFWSVDKSGGLCICANEGGHKMFMDGNWQVFRGLMLPDEIAGPVPRHHIDRAKSARFEFGETP